MWPGVFARNFRDILISKLFVIGRIYLKVICDWSGSPQSYLWLVRLTIKWSVIDQTYFEMISDWSDLPQIGLWLTLKWSVIGQTYLKVVCILLIILFDLLTE